MASPYARKRSGGSPYAINRSGGGSAYAQTRGGRGGPVTKANPNGENSGDGFFHRLGSDLLNAAENAPTGIAEFGKAFGLDVADSVAHPTHEHGKRTTRLLKQMAKATEETVKHPLRHPGDTLLLGLPAVGRVAKLGEAGALAKAGAPAREVVKAATVGAKPGERVLKVGGMEARGHYSRAAGSRVMQKGVDKALAKGATISGGRVKNAVGERVENALHRRAAKFNDRTERVIDARERAAGTIVAKLGEKLKPDELRALRLVAEEVPVERRVAAQQLRKARAASAKETKAHQERIDLTQAAQRYLDEGPDGKPVFKPEATRLRRAYAAMEKAVGSREKILEHLNLLDREAQQAAKRKVGRLVAGEPVGKDALPLDYGTQRIADMPSGALETRLAKIDAQYRKLVESAMGGKPGDYKSLTALQNGRLRKGDYPTVREMLLADAEKALRETMRRNPDHPAVQGWAQRLEEADAIRKELQRRGDVAVGLEKGRLGPEPPKLYEPSESALFIGNPVERTKLRGRPKVSSTRTFGHTQKPSSLKKMTGSSVEHALERNDVTQIVAERHHEAVRLDKIRRVAQRAAKAGETTPRRKDDVWVWTDKTVSQERIPREVRKYLDDPESIRSLPAKEHASVVEQLKSAFFEQPRRGDWDSDPETKAAFEKLAKEKKGVFVPRRLLGETGKPTYVGTESLGGQFADAVNNAQKLALVYLKVNYPVVQGLSNAALAMIHGAADPFHISRTVKDFHAEPELVSVVKDIVGEGFVPQAAFSGKNIIARGSQKFAHAMSSKVDTPFRLLIFHKEAERLGYHGKEGLKRLIYDDASVNDLVEAAQRAKEAAVDFTEMSARERKFISKWWFVYPWQKGATMYAAHFVRDHPVQAAALGLLGEQGAEINQRKLGDTPTYLRGSFDVGGRLVNPAGVNFFQTPAQIGEAAAGFATGNPTAPTGVDFLAPAPGLGVALATRRDDLGFPLEGNLAERLRDTLVAPTAGAQLARAALGNYRLARSVFGTRNGSQTFPNPNDAFYRFLIGGLYPRQYSRPALNENAARQKAGR